MEDTAYKTLYKEYLDDVLNIKYKKVDVQRVSKRLDSTFYLKPRDGSSIDVASQEKFNEITELENGNLLGYKKLDDEYVFFNSDGEELKRISHVYIGKFFDGIARVTSKIRPFLSGYIDINGKEITEIKWGFSSRDFSCGIALVEGTNEVGVLGRYGYINKEGVFVIPFKSPEAYSFSDDVCAIVMEGKKYFYDKDGKELFSDQLADINFHDGVVRFEGVNGKYGFKNKKGEVVIKPKFSSVSVFNNGIAKSKNGYINLRGDYVRVGSYDDGVKYIKGLLKPIYFNSVKNTYDKMLCIPYKDMGDYLLCVQSSEIVIYSKESGVYTRTGIYYELGNVSVFLKGNLLSINDNVFYLSPKRCVNFFSTINIKDISSYEEFSDVMSYEKFVASSKNDKDFVNKAKQAGEDAKRKNLQNEINSLKSNQDSKRQEIINELEKLKSALNKLDDTSGKLSHIDVDLLLMVVDDHLEVNPDFVSQLKYLDLSYVNFANVKVDGLDFAGSNASIDPQTVYQKNMSNGKYDGLSFNAKSFDGVNIKDASFKDCNMDFAMMDGAITDDSYEDDIEILTL